MTFIPSPPARLGGQLGHLETRRAEVNRINDFNIHPNRVTGFHEIIFNGPESTQEILLEVTFPVWFVDKPGISFSAELMREDMLVEGSFPTISLVVSGWEKIHDVRPGGGYFTGARFAVVASGPEGTEMIVHWQADGKAMHLTGMEGGVG